MQQFNKNNSLNVNRHYFFQAVLEIVDRIVLSLTLPLASRKTQAHYSLFLSDFSCPLRKYFTIKTQWDHVPYFQWWLRLKQKATRPIATEHKKPKFCY